MDTGTEAAVLEESIRGMEDAYADWEESTRRHEHESSIRAKLDSLPDSDVCGRHYQMLRLRHSDAYFTGHPLYCGDDWLCPPLPDAAIDVMGACLVWASFCGSHQKNV
jgi:hypothetical protein